MISKNFVKFLATSLSLLAINISNCFSMEDINFQEDDVHLQDIDINTIKKQLDIDFYNIRDISLIEDVQKLTCSASKKLINIPELKNIIDELFDIINNSVCAFNIEDNKADTKIPINEIREKLKGLYLSDEDYLKDVPDNNNTTYKKLINYFEKQVNLRMQKFLKNINEDYSFFSHQRKIDLVIKPKITHIVSDIAQYFNVFYKILNEIEPLNNLKEYCIKNINNNSTITLIDSLKNGIEEIKKIKTKYFFIQIPEFIGEFIDIWNNLMSNASQSRDRVSGEIIENYENMLNSDIASLGLDLIINLYKVLGKITNYKNPSDSKYVDRLYEFGKYYSSITAILNTQEIDNIVSDMRFINENNKTENTVKLLNPNDVKYSPEDLNKNTNRTFNLNIENGSNITLPQLLQYFSNKITLKVIDMISKIENTVWNRLPINEQELTNIVTTNIFSCIKEIKCIASNAAEFLKNDKQFNIAFGKTNIAETIINSITNGINNLDNLTKKYNEEDKKTNKTK